jgi:flagellar biosynthesis protein FliQ
MMGNDFAMHLLADVLWNAIVVCAPFVLLTLATGLVVSILQAITQIQDATLSFVPKIIVAGLTLVAFGPWMLRRLVSFSTNAINGIANMM